MRQQNPYIPVPVEVKKITVESDDKMLRTFDVAFCSKEDSFDFMPGQFCELSILGKGEAPFGIASSPTEKGMLKFTVNRVGVVTTALHYLNEGELIGLRGPLGNWYPVGKFKGHNVVIIGGGFAFTTLRALTVYLLENRKDYKELIIIYGARRPGLLLYRDELDGWGKRADMQLYRCIDWKFGDKGPIEEPAAEGWEAVNLKEPSKTEISEGVTQFTAFVPQLVEAVKPSPKNAYAVVCGPPIMIKFTLPILSKLGWPADKIYTSLERRMKCGIGKCGRCNIGPKYVCLDGPVFSYAEIQKLPKDE